MANIFDEDTVAPDISGALTIIVVGASGDLARKKTYPALFDLFKDDLLQKNVVLVGYARSNKTDEDFREQLKGYLNASTQNETQNRDDFLQRCIYRNGESYDDKDAWSKLAEELAALESKQHKKHSTISNRLFYLALPPSAYHAAASAIHACALSDSGWNRVVMEKPFGKDLSSSDSLSADIAKFFSEEQLYRIDHYLGKEMVQNLMVLRFANAVFEPLWNRHHISTVQITFKEPFGTEGRAGYFDNYGIIRDVMQNHLLQVLSLVAMEAPVSMNSEDVRNEKVKVLRAIPPVRPEDVVLGQYGPNAQRTKPGYIDDKDVPNDSKTPTFATAVLYINNPRWYGVPFILKCGKALNERKAEIRIQFKQPPNVLFGGFGYGRQCECTDRSTPTSDSTKHSDLDADVSTAADTAAAIARSHPEFQRQVSCLAGITGSCLSGETTASSAHNNELVMRIQPDEAVYMKIMSKMPGLTGMPVETDLNLTYKARYPTRKPPEAYARLILDILRGDQSQFVRADELRAAWTIFTPLLRAVDAHTGSSIPLHIYPFGSRGPTQSDHLIQDKGYQYEGTYSGAWRRQMAPETTAAIIQAVQDEFALPLSRLQTLLNDFIAEMRRGLAGEVSSLRMITSFVTKLPTGQEKGTEWAIDLGGTNLRVAKFYLDGEGKVETKSVWKNVLPSHVVSGSCIDLFQYLAQACKEAGIKNGDRLGLTFSYPVKQIALDKGTLIAWTKNMNVQGVVGAEVVQLLRDALRDAGLSDVNVVALVNDTVGTLVSGAYSRPNCKAGVILGTGTNAAYIEDISNIKKWNGSHEGKMLINMEWGNFGSGEGGRRLLPLTEIDHAIDAASENPSQQRFEKMISGNYLGSIAQRMILRLIDAGALLSAETGLAPTARLRQHNTLLTEHVSRIEEDETPDMRETGKILADLGIPTCSTQDRAIIRSVCTMVAKRAARLAAVGIAAILAQLGPEAKGASVGIDGSLYKHHPRFDLWISTTLKELGFQCELFEAVDGSGIGAALVAATA